MRQNVFFHTHPAVLFLYFIGVLGLTMSFLQPVLTGLSYLTGSFYFIFLRGLGRYARRLPSDLVIILIVTAVNALLNGLGLSVLFYCLKTPVTREAVAYGLCSGVMLVSVLQWFSCCQELLSGDKFLHLFGGVAPTLSLMISMVFRYIPDTIRKAEEIQTARKALLGNEKLTRRQRTAAGIRMASILMSWSLENSIETADSMRARGFSSRPKRSRYTHERFSPRDGFTLCLLLFFLLIAFFFLLQGDASFSFYPYLSPLPCTSVLWLAFTLFLTCPLLLEGRERLRWLRFSS